MDKENNHDMGSSGADVAAQRADRVLDLSEKQQAHYGTNVTDGIGPTVQANISESFTHGISCMDNNVPSLVPGGDVGLNLNEDKSNGLKEVNKEVGLAAIKPSKQLAKWTRLNRMEDGPTDLISPLISLCWEKDCWRTSWT